MKIAVVGDVGQPIYHVGDEAMTHAAIDELRVRDLDDILVFTRNVEDSQVAFHAETAPTLAFPWPPHERSAYLHRVLAAAHGDSGALSELDPAWDFIAQLRRCDALLVAGGGNMNSLYGWLLYERVAAVRIARMLGLRVVVTGQTLGPDLHGPDRDAARSLLEAAGLVGARESSSLQLMRELVPGDTSVRSCLDDASFMSETIQKHSLGSTSPVNPQADMPEGSYIAATFSPGHGEIDRNLYVTTVAAMLDEACEQTGLPVVFLPHMATPHLRSSSGRPTRSAGPSAEQDTHRVLDVDERMHHEIAARMRSKGIVLLPVQSAYRTIELTRRAAMVITSRYHPVVFALGAGIPVVALAPETYSEVRMRGALQNWGLGNLALTLPSLLDGTFTRAVADVWHRRAGLTSYLTGVRSSRLTQHRQWWDDVASALQGHSTPHLVSPPTVLSPPAFDSGWQDQAAASARVFLPTVSVMTGLHVENEHLRGEVEALRRERDDSRNELTAWLNSRSFKLARRIGATASRVRRSK